MQVSVETTSGLERKLTVGIPATQIDKEVDKRLQELARTQRIPGFRPGKIPLSVIKKRYGSPVRQEVAGEAMQRSFFEAVSKENLKPAGMPSLNPVVNEYGKDLEFEATFEIFPEVSVSNLEEISIEKPQVEITDADLDEMLLTLRKQRQTWTSAEREVADGDKVVIDFTGTMDGEAFDGGAAEGFSLVLGSNSMIPGFESGLIGAEIGGELVLDLSFPEDYHKEELKGKAVQFAVTVKSVEEPVLPVLDDEFAKAFGVEDGGLEQLQQEVRKNMQRELDQTIKNRIKESVIEQLISLNNVDIPKSLLDQEIGVLRNQAMQRISQGQKMEHLPELPDALFEEQARKRVSSGLLVSEIVKQNDIKADAEKVRETIESLASAYEKPEEVVNWYYSNKQQMDQIEAVVLEDQVVDLLSEKGQTTEKPMGFNELMHPEKNT